MRASDRLSQLQKVVEIRRMQRDGAEMAARRTRLALATLLAERGVREAAFQADLQAWSGLRSASRFDPQRLGYLAGLAAESGRRLAVADTLAERGRQESFRRNQSWKDAMALLDACERLVDEARSRIIRRREENSLNELADRVTQRRLVQ